MPGNVTRLPTQHKQKPHCSVCKEDLPTFKGMSLSVNPTDLGETEIEAITFHVRCKCGAKWDMRKEA